MTPEAELLKRKLLLIKRAVRGMMLDAIDPALTELDILHDELTTCLTLLEQDHERYELVTYDYCQEGTH